MINKYENDINSRTRINLTKWSSKFDPKWHGRLNSRAVNILHNIERSFPSTRIDDHLMDLQTFMSHKSSSSFSLSLYYWPHAKFLTNHILFLLYQSSPCNVAIVVRNNGLDARCAIWITFILIYGLDNSAYLERHQEFWVKINVSISILYARNNRYPMRIKIPKKDLCKL